MEASLFNSQNQFYKTPFGAVACGKEVYFAISVPEEFCCKTPYMLLNRDGEEPSLLPLVKETVISGREIFSLRYTPTQVGLYFYYFDLYTDYRKIFCGEMGEGYITQGNGEKYQLTVYEKDFETPKDLYGGVMYQIFPDRFYEGEKKTAMPFDRIYREDKENEPYFWPNEQHEGYLNMDYFGGDFAGIEQKLPYLEDLGVTMIYLNPIFEAHSNHRYNTADYMHADPVLGTNQDFAHLCKEAKCRGIKIILDGVFSHTGSDSVYFNKEGRYPQLGAWQGENSIYRNWYIFSDEYKHGYRSWWGFETLPEVNEENADFRNFVCGDGGVIDYWLSLGADGFRLDVADELPDDFIQAIRIAVKKHGADKYLLGEVWDDASNKTSYDKRRTYLLGKGLDSVMNYPFKDAVMAFLRGGNAKDAANIIMHICENYPLPALNTAMNFVSTHDTVRGITALGGEEIGDHDRYWQSEKRMNKEQYCYARRLLRLAYAIIYTLPGIPSIYYGDEICTEGYKDPFNRSYFNWKSEEHYLLPTLHTLSELRKNCSALRDGALIIHEANEGFLHYERKNNESSVHILINRSHKLECRAVCGSIREILSLRYLICTQDENT
ncbi:MAG: glycoside hydrolase family 13 protein [Oscillospiraceae bacterium]